MLACWAGLTRALLQVGEHFAQWGRVMDVVLIKDLKAILEHCSRMASLQQDVEFAEQKESFSHKKGPARDIWRAGQNPLSILESECLAQAVHSLIPV